MTDLELMQQALEAMGAVGADAICEASHHAKKDQHKWGEPCPLQQRWHIAYQALRERLARPERREWRGLTEAEKVNVALACGCADIAWMDFAAAIEAKLKEKNA